MNNKYNLVKSNALMLIDVNSLGVTNVLEQPKMLTAGKNGSELDEHSVLSHQLF